MSNLRDHFEAMQKAFGDKNLYNRFFLAHAHTYPIGPNTYAGPRQEQNNCYGNATTLALEDRSLTYVEGKLEMMGMPFDHAWCIDADGVVVDPTIERTETHGEYFGVPFKTDYVARAIVRNGIYGLLDIIFASETAPKLFELGLEAGQQWLLDQPYKTSKRLQRRFG